MSSAPISKKDREIYIYTEFEISQTLIFKGIEELESIDFVKMDYYPPLLLLSNGLERLMKCVLLVIHWDKLELDDEGKIKDEQMPFGYKGKSAHRLAPLLKNITDYCNQNDYESSGPFSKEDLEYITNNQELLELIDIFSQFGEESRYYNLNVVINGLCDDTDPVSVMSHLENEYIKKGETSLEDFLKSNDKDELFHQLYDGIISFIARFCIAMYRILTTGKYSSISSSMSIAIGDFMTFADKYDPAKEEFVKMFLDSK